MSFNLPVFDTDEFSFGPCVVYIGPAGSTPTTVGHRVVTSYANPAQSGEPKGRESYGNPEGLSPRGEKPCRDFDAEDSVDKHICLRVLHGAADTSDKSILGCNTQDMRGILMMV